MKMYTFTNKADVLKSIESSLSLAKVKTQVSFTVDEWGESSQRLIGLVQSEIVDPILIVRSSALNEDCLEESNAGLCLSVPGVAKTDQSSIEKAVNEVIESYGQFDSGASKDEHKILIQGQVEDIKTIGVMFTSDLTTLAPYYIVNYQDDGSIDSVTSGKEGGLKTYVRFKKSSNPVKDAFLDKLIKTATELEKLFENQHLDIEFVIDGSGELYILQVRPIVIKNKEELVDEHVLEDALVKIHKKIDKLGMGHPYLYGKGTQLGVMPDWNPAEILGERPRTLALSLYKELITDSIWAYQRNNYGYKDVRSFPLLRILMGLAYIDVRVSFNSFIPKEVGDDLSHRLVNYYMEKLARQPQNHDKVEFEIIYSCYYLDLPEKIQKLSEHGFSSEEIEEIKFSLLKLTNRILDPQEGLLDGDLRKIATLKQRQEELLNSSLPTIDKIYWLLEDCKRYGTLPFAGLARCGFIAKQFLKSFIELNIITHDEYHQFMSSLSSVTKKFADDCLAVEQGTLSKEAFLKDYGHLRPGTYDILSLRYDEGFDRYFSDCAKSSIESTKHADFTFSQKTLGKIDEYLAGSGLTVSAQELIDFIKRSIEGREYGKFIFTKSISETMILIEEFGQRFGLSREDLSFLDVERLLDSYSTLDNEDIPDFFAVNINRNREAYRITSALKLPQFITKSDEVYDSYLGASEPNFVTLLRTTGEVLTEDQLSAGNLGGKIVFIQSADPGFDWIFSKGIAGLVTMYGGANSHMAIRTAELGIPAVIGAGSRHYQLWSKAKLLELDCGNKHVTRLR